MPVDQQNAELLKDASWEGGDSQKALTSWEDTWKNNPRIDKNVCGFARAMERNGDIDGAINLCQSSFSYIPTYSQYAIVNQLQTLFRAKNDPAGEIDLLRAIRETYPNANVIERLSSLLFTEEKFDDVIEICDITALGRVTNSH